MVQKEAKKRTCAHLGPAVLLIIMIVSMVCVIGSASFTPAASGSLSEKETDPINYAGGLAAKLKSSFNTTTVDGNLVILYPVEYGGAYLDQSTLHIVLSKYATNSTIDTYRSIMGDPDVIFETAEYPLSYLYSVQDALYGVMLEYSIDACGVHEMTNRVDVNLHNSTRHADVIAYLNSQFNDFNESCITFLGPLELSIDLPEVNPPMATPESNSSFLGTNIPMIYGAAAIAIVAVTVGLACYLVFVRHA